MKGILESGDVCDGRLVGKLKRRKSVDGWSYMAVGEGYWNKAQERAKECF